MTEDFYGPADDDVVPVFVDHVHLAGDLRQVETAGRGVGEPAIADVACDDPRLGDALLLKRLVVADLRGPEYDAFIHELSRYGLAVMTAWTIDGTVFARASKLGRPVAVLHRPTDRRTRRDDAMAIANLVAHVIVGTSAFWSAITGLAFGGGAGAATYGVARRRQRRWEKLDNDADDGSRDPYQPEE